MVNVESLLSPSGGRGYEDTVNSGLSGLVLGLGLSETLYDKFLGKPVMEEFRSSTQPGYKAKRNKLLKSLEALNKKLETLSDNDYPTENPEKVRRARDKVKEALKNHRKQYKAQKSALKTTLGIDKKFIKGASWMTLVSFGLDIAIEGFTPGVSKVAARNDQRSMEFQNPLDSQASYTMRQRAVMAIHDSMMNVKNVIGNEAQFMHR